MELFSVPLTVDQLATAVHKYACPERMKSVSLCFSHVVVSSLTSSAQVKNFPDKAVKLWNSLGANSRTDGRCSSVPNQTLQQLSSLLCRVQLGIFMEKNHTVVKKASFLALPTNNHITRWTSKQDQFSKWVTMLKFHDCAPSMPVPRLTRPWS